MSRVSPGTLARTFDEMCVDGPECILWPHSRSRGYGVMKVEGKPQAVHRLSCTQHHGPAPTPNHVAAHSCRNKHCFNPRHLRWATPKENQADRIADGTNLRGTDHPGCVLTESDVRHIRDEVSRGTTQQSLADHYGVSRSTVTAIVGGVTWAWLS